MVVIIKNFDIGGNNIYNPLDNENHAKHVHNTMNKLFLLADSIVKNFNGYFLTKKLRNRKLIKVRSFTEAKVRCMYNHVKPII